MGDALHENMKIYESLQARLDQINNSKEGSFGEIHNLNDVMKQLLKRSIVTSLLAIPIVFFGCTSSKLLVPSQADINRVDSQFADFTLADLNRGKALYETHCGKCHGLKSPTSQSEEAWIRIVPDMCDKVNKRSMLLDEAAQEDILRYVVTMSKAPQPSK